MTEYKDKKIIMSKIEMSRTIKRLAHEIVEKNFGTKDLAVIGVQTRGVVLAKRILNEINDSGLNDSKTNIPFGTLDINLYRDDLETLKAPPTVKETDIAFDVSNKKIVLVDDVIFTGRSIRAAMDEIMDFGRPASIQLVVLVDRGHRELPIEPNFTGKKFTTFQDEFINVNVEEVDDEDKVVLKEKKSKGSQGTP